MFMLNEYKTPADTHKYSTINPIFKGIRDQVETYRPL